MLNDLPKACDVGTKKNSKGYKTSWIGYKLHLDVADGGIPISAVLTSASTHDSQVAIPLAIISNGRVTNLYDAMDSAYDVPQIHEMSQLRHIPLSDVNPRRNQGLKNDIAAEIRSKNTIDAPTSTRKTYTPSNVILAHIQVQGRLPFDSRRCH